jgi:hypothetical protein
MIDLKKQDPSVCCLQEMPLTGKDMHRESESGEEDFPSKCNLKASRSSYAHI